MNDISDFFGIDDDAIADLSRNSLGLGDIALDTETVGTSAASTISVSGSISGEGEEEGFEIHDSGQLSDGTPYAFVDYNGDGRPDQMMFDTDGDGAVDLVIERIEGGVAVYVDGTGEGTFEEALRLTDAEFAEMNPEAYQLMVDADLDYAITEVVYPDIDEGRIIGDPFAYGDEWFYQAFNGSCLPAAVAQIYNEYMGTNVSDLDFVQLANEQQLWVVDEYGVPGLPVDAAVTLLDAAGIPAQHLTDQTINDLAAYLSPPPHAVMVAIDADVYWEGAPADYINHAVLITGIDPVNGVVYLSDTGTPDGNMIEVDIDQFLEAWEAGDNQLVVTDMPAEEFQQANAVEYPESEYAETEYPAETEEAPEYAGSASESSIGPVAEWVREHAWVLLPITLGAEALVQNAESAGRD